MSEMIEEITEETTEKMERVPFVVDSDQKADWCLRKIKEYREEIEKWTAHYEAEKRRACMDYESSIIRWEAELRGYLYDRNEKGLTRETKTMVAYNLPSGKIYMKQQEPEYEKDESKIIEWLRENAPELIKVKETVDWAGMKKEFSFSGDKMVSVDEETGEIKDIPGVRVIPREDKFNVEVK